MHVARTVGLEQFLGLSFQLIEVRVRRKLTIGSTSGRGHDELLSWPRVRVGRCPVSARSGRKEFIERSIVPTAQVDAVLSADTVAP